MIKLDISIKTAGVLPTEHTVYGQRVALPQVADGVCDYQTLQNWLLDRAERIGLSYELDESRAYAVKLDGIFLKRR